MLFNSTNIFVSTLLLLIMLKHFSCHNNIILLSVRYILSKSNSTLFFRVIIINIRKFFIACLIKMATASTSKLFNWLFSSIYSNKFLNWFFLYSFAFLSSSDVLFFRFYIPFYFLFVFFKHIQTTFPIHRLPYLCDSIIISGILFDMAVINIFSYGFYRHHLGNYLLI